MGLMRLAGLSILRRVSLAYIEFFRGVPMIVTILFTFFAFPILAGSILPFEINEFNAMLIACVLWTSANAAEIVRGAVQAIPFGQTEAATALGMNYIQRMRLVILPQAVKIMVPPMIGLFTLLLKGTAIGFIIGYMELLRITQITVERTMASIQIYTVAMVIYFIMCYPLTQLSLYFERRLARGQVGSLV